MCFLFKETFKCRKEIRCRRPRIAGGLVVSWMETLVRGVQDSFFGLDWSQEPRVSEVLIPDKRGGHLFFGRFNFSLSYRPRTRNVKPYTLSRQFEVDQECSGLAEEYVLLESVRCSINIVDIEKVVMQAHCNQLSPSDCPNDNMFVPEKEGFRVRSVPLCFLILVCPKPLALFKLSFGGCHCFQSTEFVTACPLCDQSKTSKRSPFGFLQPLSIPTRPWSNIAIDLIAESLCSEVTPLYSPSLTDFSRWFILLCCPNSLLWKKWWRSLLVSPSMSPDRLCYWQGPRFVSQFWSKFCSLLGISVHLTSQNGRQTERANQQIKTKIHILCESDPNKLASQLPRVKHAINSAPSSITGPSPFFVVFGFQPPMSSIQEKDSKVPLTRLSALRYREGLERSLQNLWLAKLKMITIREFRHPFTGRAREYGFLPKTFPLG